MDAERELLDDVRRFSAASRENHAIEIVRRFDAVLSVNLDRAEVLQVVREPPPVSRSYRCLTKDTQSP